MNDMMQLIRRRDIAMFRNAMDVTQAALEQALDCVNGETPEDMTTVEAEEDTCSKIRDALRCLSNTKTVTGEPSVGPQLEGVATVNSGAREAVGNSYIIDQHICWLKGYVELMDETNWRDMQLYAERQLGELSEELGKPRGECVRGSDANARFETHQLNH